MTNLTTAAIIDAFNEAVNQHDVAATMALMTEDCVFENTSPFPDGTRYEGQAAVRDFWTNFFKDSPHAHFDFDELITTEDRGITRWTYHWIDSEGKAGHIRGVDVFRVRDGKVAEKLSYVKG